MSSASASVVSEGAKSFAARYCQLLAIRHFFKLVVQYSDVHAVFGPARKYRIYINNFNNPNDPYYRIYLGVTTSGIVNLPSSEKYYRYDPDSTEMITNYLKHTLEYTYIYIHQRLKPVSQGSNKFTAEYLKVILDKGFKYREWAFTALGGAGVSEAEQAPWVTMTLPNNSGFDNHYSERLSLYAIFYGQKLIEIHQKYEREDPLFFQRRNTRKLRIDFRNDGTLLQLTFVGGDGRFANLPSYTGIPPSSDPEATKVGPSDMLTVAVMFSDGNTNLIEPNVHTFLYVDTDFAPHFQQSSFPMIEGTGALQVIDEGEQQSGSQYGDATGATMQMSMGDSTEWQMQVSMRGSTESQMEQEEVGTPMPMAATVQTLELRQSSVIFGEDSEDSF